MISGTSGWRSEFAVVFWHDAHGTPGSKRKSRCRPWCKISVGFVIEENETGIEIASELNEDGTHEYTAFIPAGMVQGIVRRKMPKIPGGFSG